jgi:glutathione S-transferase
MHSIKLYFAPFTRSTRPRWMLEELGVPYEIVRVDMSARAHKEPSYLASIHPHGAVPAADIDGQHIIESTAIVMALADLFPDKSLAPALGTPERIPYTQWMVYAQATIDPAIADVISARKPDGATPDDKKAAAEERWAQVAGFLEKGLGDKPWFLGDFTAVDVMMGSLMAWANSQKLLEGHPKLVEYVQRCRARPAFASSRN